MPGSFAARATDEAFDAFRLGVAGRRLESVLNKEAVAAVGQAHEDEMKWWAQAIGIAYGEYVCIGLEVFDHIEARLAEAA